MTLKQYIAIMTSTTIVCWLIFSFIVNSVNPDSTNWLGFVLFYISLFLSVTGTAAVVGFIVRFIGLKKTLAFYSVREAFRQSFLFAFLISAVLFLLSKALFTWLNLIFLVAGLSVLEYFLLSISHRGHRISDNFHDQENNYLS